MALALILPLIESSAGRSLAAIRQLADPDSRSEPHITVRYPIKRIDLAAIQSSLEAEIPAIDVLGPGSFSNRRGDRSVLYLECASDLLEAFRYKPEFPDSIFHITLYEGMTSAFSADLLSSLYRFPWHLAVKFRQPVRFQEIEVGVGANSRKRTARFSPETLTLLARLDPALTSAEIDGLSDARRLELIRLVIEHLHAKSDTAASVPIEATPQRLRSVNPDVEQQSLWVSAPVPSEDAGHRLTGAEARGGSLVLTPPELAEEIVGYALQVHHDAALNYGEPAFGSGIFFAVLMRLAEAAGHTITTASAVEVNSDRARVAAERWQQSDLQMLVGDFLAAEPMARWDFVVANPPYVRSQDISDDVKLCVSQRLHRERGLRVPARSNLYVYFVLICHEWLLPGGTAAWLLPADFLATRYGQILREYLTQQVTLVRLHTYDSADPRFENVRVSSAVVVYKNSPPYSGAKVAVSRGGSLSRPKTSENVALEELHPEFNWQLAGRGCRRPPFSTEAPTLGELFRIRRGIATGANKYFVLEESRAVELGLELEELKPVLPRPRYMPDDGVIEASQGGLPATSPRLFLIDSSDSIEHLADRAPGLARYLRGVPKEVLTRHLIQRRRIYYQQERREIAMLVASAMGRFVGERGPVTYYLNLSRAVVLNNYLCLYPRDTKQVLTLLQGRTLLEILRSIDRDQYRRLGREYAGAMYKLEPRELGCVQLPKAAADAAEAILRVPESTAMRGTG